MASGAADAAKATRGVAAPGTRGITDASARMMEHRVRARRPQLAMDPPSLPHHCSGRWRMLAELRGYQPAAVAHGIRCPFIIDNELCFNCDPSDHGRTGRDVRNRPASVINRLRGNPKMGSFHDVR